MGPGPTHPPTSKLFLDFLNFFNFAKPLSGSFIPPSLFTIPPTSPPPPVSPPVTISQIRLDQDYGERTRSEAAASSGVELRCHDDAFTGLKLRANY